MWPEVLGNADTSRRNDLIGRMCQRGRERTEHGPPLRRREPLRQKQRKDTGSLVDSKKRTMSHLRRRAPVVRAYPDEPGDLVNTPSALAPIELIPMVADADGRDENPTVHDPIRQLCSRDARLRESRSPRSRVNGTIFVPAVNRRRPHVERDLCGDGFSLGQPLLYEGLDLRVESVQLELDQVGALPGRTVWLVRDRALDFLGDAIAPKEHTVQRKLPRKVRRRPTPLPRKGCAVRIQDCLDAVLERPELRDLNGTLKVGAPMGSLVRLRALALEDSVSVVQTWK